MGRLKISIDQSAEDVIADGDGDFEWRISGVSDSGNFEGGGCWAVLASGEAQVNRVLPLPDTFNSNDINGLARDPVGGNAFPQGVDGALRNYSSALNLSLPLTVAPNDILVKSKGLDFVPDENRDGQLDNYSSCFILESAPAANSFAPSTLTWTGRGTLTPYVADISALVASLPSYSTANQPNLPTYQEIIDRIKYWSPFTAFDVPLTRMYQEATPNQWQKTNTVNENYGGYLIRTFNKACLALISDGFTTAQKETIAKLLCGHGFQMYEYLLRNMGTAGTNGGHWQFYQGFVGLAVHASGGGTTTLIDDIKGCWPQAFEMTQAILDQLVPHTDVDKPYPWRERLITAVDTGANTVTVAVDNGGSINTDPARVDFNGMDIIRKSDGARINVTDQNTTQTGSPPIVLTVAGQPAGGDFAVNDVITFDVPTDFTLPAVGEYDWSNQGLYSLHAYNPMPNATYREQNKWTGQVCLLKALGITGDIDPVYGYVKRANTANTPAGYDMPNHHFITWESEFWAEHGATLFP